MALKKEHDVEIFKNCLQAFIKKIPWSQKNLFFLQVNSSLENYPGLKTRKVFAKSHCGSLFLKNLACKLIKPSFL
ncbi:hypothetical protein ACO0LC_00620 [Undibacterium sp. JH2W]|uniref:hypothetical protein n=1 Tax=Undibacterium sp. JH2W TaxID=3413037 RepID=UPI003BF178BC